MHSYNPSYIQLLKKDFGKFTFYRTFGAHKLVPSEPFWTTYTNFDTCYQRYVATCGKIYIGAHLHSQPTLNYCVGKLFKSLSYLYEVVRTNFSADFWTFRNFWREFRENCGATWRRKWEPCSASDRQSLLKQKAQLMLTNPCDAFTPGMVSY